MSDRDLSRYECRCGRKVTLQLDTERLVDEHVGDLAAVKVMLDIKGGDAELIALIKEWIAEHG